jgi:NTE family protein
MAKKVGLALGSGGARGWAHIGAIRALEAAGITIDYIAGTSIGAFVGGIYAVNQLYDLEEFVKEIDWKTIVSLLDVDFPTQGLLDGDKVYDLIYAHVLDCNLEETTIPFHCVATDLSTQQAVILKTGSMVDAVRASLSIPGVFTPFNREETYLVDGGVINPVPVDVVQAMGSDIVIAINLNYPYSLPPEDSTEAETNADTQPILSEMKSSESSTKTGEEDNQTNRIALLNTIKSRYEAVQETLAQKMNNWLPERSKNDPQIPNIFDVIGNTINIMEQQVTQINLQLYQPDILLQPRLSQYGIFDFHQAETLMQEGYRCVEAALPEIKEKLSD